MLCAVRASWKAVKNEKYPNSLMLAAIFWAEGLSLTPPYPLEPDAKDIRAFVDALFRYADPGTYVSMRAFRHDKDGVFFITPYCIDEASDEFINLALREAARAAAAPYPVVFASPIATFLEPDSAAEEALANGLVLSVECDANPQAARLRLEALLGPPTVIVQSGGEWVRPATGEIEPKIHLHWRLNEPTRERVDHHLLKEARSLATALVGGDASNTPTVHPLRWPGSWHRKGKPKLATIAELHEAAEIDLGEALARLREAADAAGIHVKTERNRQENAGEARKTAELVRAIMAAEDYHRPLAALAMRFLKGGTLDAQVVSILQGIMLAVPVVERDIKNGKIEPGRWQARFNDIPRAVSTARAKAGEPATARAEQPGSSWPEPLDFLGDAELTGAPELGAEHIPQALEPFVFDTAERMGVDPASVALCALVSLASIINDGWRIQPKRHDTEWSESPRLWGAIVGPPSILKTPLLRAVTRPLDHIETEARSRHAEAMRAWKAEVAALKAAKGIAPIPAEPRCDRWLVEGATVEALSELLRDDDEARFRTPSGKLLVRQDELSEWIASLDQYKAGGRGGGDRGAYLRLYNGGRYVYDRVGRGSFAIPNWSACMLGGIQPEPIQRIATKSADDGLLQRFLFIVPSGQHEGLDRAPNMTAVNGYGALFRALQFLSPPRYLSGEPCPIKLSEDAHIYRELINQAVRLRSAWPDTSARLQATLGKWPGTFARIVLVFHLINHASSQPEDQAERFLEEVQEDTAKRAAAFMLEILLPHLLRAEGLLYLTEQTGHAHWIAGFILTYDTALAAGRISVRDIQRAYKPLRAPERRRELVEIMNTLEAAGWIRAELPENPARPLTSWHLNPRLQAIFADRANRERERRIAARAQAVFNTTVKKEVA